MSIEPESVPPPLSRKERVDLLKALGDESRLQVVNALIERPHCAEELAERLRRAPSTISFHLRKLDEAGLLTKTKAQYYLVYALRDELLRLTLKELVTLAPTDGAERRRLEQFRQKVLRSFFRDGELVQIPKQWRKQRIVLEQFLEKFVGGRPYQEHEVNERIKTMYADYCTIRRMLVDEGYMTRQDGVYRLASAGTKALEEGTSKTETRKELKRQYRDSPKQAGVFHIKNTTSGKVLLGSSTNLHGPLNKHRFLLSARMHPNAELQRDWDLHGEGAFTFEVLEVVQQKDDPSFSVTDELTLLEELWLEKLKPWEPHGYTKGTRIRE